MSQYFEQDYKAMGDKRFHRSSMIYDSKQLYNLSYGTNGIINNSKVTELQCINTTSNNIINRSTSRGSSYDGKHTSTINSHYDQASKVKGYDK